MSVSSLVIALVLNVAFGLFVWWLLGRTRLGSWLERLRKSARPEGGRHDPDAAFEQRIPTLAATVLGALFAFALSLILYLAIGFFASWEFRDIRVGPGELAALGYKPEQIGVVTARLRDSAESADGERIVKKFTGDVDPEAALPEARGLLASFLESEANGGAPAALIDQLFEAAGQPPTNVDTRDALTRHLRHRCLDALDPPPAAKFFTGLGQEAGTKELHQHLRQGFEKSRGKQVIVISAYEKIRAKVREHRRVRVMFVDFIQAVTYWLFFVGLILIRGRANGLDVQETGYAANWTAFAEKRNLEKHLRTSPIPDYAALNEADVAVQLAKQRQTTLDYCTSDDGLSKDRHYFVLGVLQRLWDELTKRGLCGDWRQAGRELIKPIFERSESRIERVEYSTLQFIIYAIPSTGFIGTVIGIGIAMGSADLVVRATDALEQAEAISRVTAVLGVAFDTTLVALVCSIPLMLLVGGYRALESKFLLDIHGRLSTQILEQRPENDDAAGIGARAPARVTAAGDGRGGATRPVTRGIASTGGGGRVGKGGS